MRKLEEVTFMNICMSSQCGFLSLASKKLENISTNKKYGITCHIHIAENGLTQSIHLPLFSGKKMSSLYEFPPVE